MLLLCLTGYFISFQLSVDCLGCFDCCIQFVMEERNELVHLQDILSLPTAVLYVIHSAFSHCKSSDKIYGKFFQSVSTQLTTLFKNSFALQKVIIYRTTLIVNK